MALASRLFKATVNNYSTPFSLGPKALMHVVLPEIPVGPLEQEPGSHVWAADSPKASS